MSADLVWYRFADMPPALLYEVLRFRQEIFVVEQRSPYPDLDGLDENAMHLLLWCEDAWAGYLRLLPQQAERTTRIGRVAVAVEHRREGLARRMMDEALTRCRSDYPDCRVLLSAQTYLVPFYQSFGFAVISPPYDDYGVPHVDMELRGRPGGDTR